MTILVSVLTAAVSGLTANLLIGPRRGRTDGSGALCSTPGEGSFARWRQVSLSMLAGLALWFVVGWPLAVATIGVGVLVAPLRRAASRRRDDRRRAHSVPDVIELFVLVVRAGLTTRQALHFLAVHAPGVARPAFVAAVALLDRGHAPPDALGALPLTLGRGIEPVVDLIGPADRYGLPLAPALEQLAIEGRDSRRRLAEAAARRLPVRLSFPLVVCTLPSFVLLAVAPAVLAALSSLGGNAW